MTAPHRVTETILKSALGNKHLAHPTDVVVKEFSLSPGCDKGDGYSCDLKKVLVNSEVRGKPQRDTFICKSVPMGEVMAQMVKEVMIFRVEILCYNEIVPKLNKIAAEHGLEQIAVPEVYYANEEEGVIVMQDLKAEGFGIQGRGIGLDLDHMKLFLKQLAKFHGLSYHWINTYFGGLERFKKDLWFCNGEDRYNTGSKAAADFLTKMSKINFSTAVMVIEESPEDQELLEPFKEFANERYWKTKVEPHKPKGPFNCFIHNDAWCNNLMFRDNPDGTPKDVFLIDLQLCRRARPTVDLAYLLVSSLSAELRNAHREELLKYYHDELTRILVKLDYKEDTYTFEQLKFDYQECYAYAFAIGIGHAQAQSTDPNNPDGINLQKLIADESEDAMDRLNKYLRKEAKGNQKLRQKMLDLIREARVMKLI